MITSRLSICRPRTPIDPCTLQYSYRRIRKYHHHQTCVWICISYQYTSSRYIVSSRQKEIRMPANSGEQASCCLRCSPQRQRDARACVQCTAGFPTAAWAKVTSSYLKRTSSMYVFTRIPGPSRSRQSFDVERLERLQGS